MGSENMGLDPVRELMAAEKLTKLEAIARLHSARGASVEVAQPAAPDQSVKAVSQEGLADTIPIDRTAVENAQERFRGFWEAAFVNEGELAPEDVSYIGFMFDSFVSATNRGSSHLSSVPFTDGLPGEYDRERLDALEELDAWTWGKTHAKAMPSIGRLAASELAEDMTMAMEFVLKQRPDHAAPDWSNESGGNGQLHARMNEQLQQGQGE